MNGDIDMTELNLRQMVRTVLDETDLNDPGEVAQKVFAELRRADYGPALQQTLRQFARVVMAESRVTPIPPIPAQQPSSSRPSPRSWKVQGVRDAWQKQLSERWHTGSGWKQLRECTVADLMFLASERHRIAAENEAVATRFTRLADLLEQHNAATVADLPGSAVADVIGAAA